MSELSLQWLKEAAQYKQARQYSQAAKLYEQAIKSQPEIRSYYWHLGLLQLLQWQEKEAQFTWLAAMMAEDADANEQASQELFEFLTTEAEQQKSQEQLELAWLIRQHAKEIQPENLDNLLEIIQISLDLGTFQGQDFVNLGVIEKLKDETVRVEPTLLLSVVKKLLNTAPLEPYVAEFVDACVPHAQPPERFIEIILVPAEKKITYLKGGAKLAVRLAESCLKLGTNQLQVLKSLAIFYQEACQYQLGIETAQKSYDLSTTLIDKIQTSSLLLRGLINAGGYWDEAFTIFEEYRTLLLEFISTKTTLNNIGLASSLMSSIFYQPYLSDDIKNNRFFQNQVARLLQSSFEVKKKVKLNNNSNKLQKATLSQTPRKIKVGYLSSGLRRYSVGWLVRWLFQYHDYNQFEVYAYFVGFNSVNFDSLQKWFLQAVTYPRTLEENSFKIADQIDADEIDILVDLDSVTNYITCGVMALKPAPIQITWLGWDASGLPEIDYFLADSQVLPEYADAYYSEKIWRLPEVYVAVDGFEIGIPTLRREELEIPTDATIYFSAQSGCKRHPNTVHLQMQILAQVPNSYFLVKGLSDQNAVQKLFTKIAEEEGIDPNRLRFLPRVPSEEVHRADLGIADVVLDTYPYNGATTSLETLWMGIPLVTRVGEQFSARNSYTFLKSVGVSEGIAWSDEEYIEWGVRLGTDAVLRQKVAWQLWQSRQTSPLWNAKQFTREMEKAYQQMWDQYINELKD